MTILFQPSFWTMLKTVLVVLFSKGPDQVLNQCQAPANSLYAADSIQSSPQKPLFEFDNLSMMWGVGVKPKNGLNLVARSYSFDEDYPYGWNHTIQASYKMSGSGIFAGGFRLVENPRVFMLGVAGKYNDISTPNLFGSQ